MVTLFGIQIALKNISIAFVVMGSSVLIVSIIFSDWRGFVISLVMIGVPLIIWLYREWRIKNGKPWLSIATPGPLKEEVIRTRPYKINNVEMRIKGNLFTGYKAVTSFVITNPFDEKFEKMDVKVEIYDKKKGLRKNEYHDLPSLLPHEETDEHRIVTKLGRNWKDFEIRLFFRRDSVDIYGISFKP